MSESEIKIGKWEIKIVLSLGVVTCHTALDAASQEQTILEPSPSPLTGEGERSSDEGDIKKSSNGLSNLFKHNDRLKSTLRGWDKNNTLTPLTRPSGTLSRKGRGINIWHLNSNMKGGDNKCLA